MGSSKKHKEKDREKRKRRHRSRSRSLDRDHGEPERKRKHHHEKHRSGRDKHEKSSKPTSTSRSVDTDKMRKHDSDYDRIKVKKSEKSDYTSVNEDFTVSEPSSREPGGSDMSLTIKDTNKMRAKLGLPPLDVKVDPDEKKEAPPPTRESHSDISLTIEQTNALRAKLGLKPLEVKTESENKDGESSSKKEDVHAPAVNLTNINKSNTLREKFALMREKRRINMMLGKVKTLGEENAEDTVEDWVAKSKKIQQDRELAEKRAKLLQEMEDEFGVTDLVKEEYGQKEETYTSKDLRGLKVGHSQEAFKEGQTVILTLKDYDVLDEDFKPTLENVNILDDEKTKINLDNKKKKPVYKPYDEPEYDEFGMLQDREILDKYDEEVYGVKKEEFELDTYGKYDAAHEKRMLEIKAALRQQGQTLTLPEPTIASEFYTQDEMQTFKKVKKKVRKIRKKPKVQTLTLPEPTIASEFYTQDEMQTFKKVKKKVRKIRKKPKVVTADDLLPLTEPSTKTSRDFGSRSKREDGEVIDTDGPREIPLEPIPGLDLLDADSQNTLQETSNRSSSNQLIPGLDLVEMEVDKPALEPIDMEVDKPSLLPPEILGPEEDLSGVVVEEDEAAKELELSLRKARKLKTKKSENKAPDILTPSIAKKIPTLDEISPSKAAGAIMLNSTSEFCRSLGEIPTYGMAGNREQEEEEELMDFEQELIEERRRKEEEEQNPGWQMVEIDTRQVEIKDEENTVLDEEPVVNQGLVGALQLAQKKGYLEEETKKRHSAPIHTDLAAQHYSIEDKRYDDLDEKFRKRDRYGGGMISDFQEKDSYKPDVKLDYVDDTGRFMSAKEAFRYLSHRFHGKGSGKKKQEKRHRKLEIEQAMKSMSSSDTPLGTASLLEDKLHREKTAYIVLSGGNKAGPGTSIAK